MADCYGKEVSTSPDRIDHHAHSASDAVVNGSRSSLSDCVQAPQICAILPCRSWCRLYLMRHKTLFTSVYPHQLLDRSSSRVFTAFHKRGGKRTFIAARQADKAYGILLQVLRRGSAFAFLSLAHFELCDELAKVLVSGLRLAEQGQARRLRFIQVRQPVGWRQPQTEAGCGHFRADMRANAGSPAQL